MAQSMMEEPKAPDWDMTDTFPTLGRRCAKVVLTFPLGFIIPKLFGPKILTPYFLAVAFSSSSSFSPSGPASLKPAVRMLTYLVPDFPTFSISSATKGALTAITAMSTAFPISSKDVYAFTPCISPPFGLTGYSSPSNLAVIMFFNSIPPSFVSSVEAPMMATDLGLRKSLIGGE